MATVRFTVVVVAAFLIPLLYVAESFSSNAPFFRREFSLTAAAEDSTTQAPPPPVLNGKRVLPYKVLLSGLKGHKVPAVYAVLNSNYKRGSEGWEATNYVGVAQDLDATLHAHLEKHGNDKVAQIRALSFSFPEPGAMQEVASQWREMATKAGAEMNDGEWAYVDALEYLYDEEDDDDEDDEFEWDDEDMAMTAQAMATVPSSTPTSEEAIVSPFENDGAAADVHVEESGKLEFTYANVDKVLEEVRPYLISDGGNVAVERIDETEKTVYLKLEGACGSCASSTVTMQMGIERVLRENFADLKEVLQVEDDPESKPTELTLQAVQDEVNRLKPAIIAMGGVVELISVDPIGVVELKYRGANKVRQGLELAILDVPFAKHVKFVDGDDE